MERGYNEFQEARPLYAQLVGGKHDPEKRARTVYRLVTIGGAAVGALALFGVVHQVSEYTQAQCASEAASELLLLVYSCR